MDKHGHRDSAKPLSIWIDKEVLKQLDAEAKRRGIPRSNLIENAFRKQLGLPLVRPPKIGRPLKDEQ